MNAVKQVSGRLSCRRWEGCHADVINVAMLIQKRLSCRCKENFQADEGKGWRGMERVNVEGVEGVEGYGLGEWRGVN